MNKFEITSESPTNHLKDFDRFIELIETFKITLTDKAQNLPIKALVEIDKEMRFSKIFQ